MSEQLTQLAGFPTGLLLLKATVKKQVWIPQFTKKNGQVVGGHYAMVHVSDDHDHKKVASGQGSYSQKKAHAKLVKEGGDDFHALPDEEKAALVMHHATQIQDADSMKARLSTLKAKLVKGEKPLGSEWKAFHAAPADLKAQVYDAAKAADKLAELDAQYAAWVSANPEQAKAAAEEQPPAAQEPAKVADPAPAAEPPKEEPKAAPEPAAQAAEAKPAPAPEPEAKPEVNLPAGAPKKPNIMGSLKAKEIADKIEAAMAAGDHGALDAAMGDVPMTSDKLKWQKIKKYAGEASNFINAQKAPAAAPAPAEPALPAAKTTSQPEQGPKEGDTKQGEGGTLVLKDGHWVLQDAEKPKAPRLKAAKQNTSAEAKLKAAISGAKVPSENTNAKSFNPKVDAILAALETGDEKSLLGMSYGTNTYGKKAAKLANDVLAHLGSEHTVTPGQKAGEHPGATLKVVAAKPAEPAPAPAPAADPAPAPAADGEPVMPENMNGSSKVLAESALEIYQSGNLTNLGDFLNYAKVGAMFQSKAVEYVEALHAHLAAKQQAESAPAAAAAPQDGKPVAPSTEGKPETHINIVAKITDALAVGDMATLQAAHALTDGLPVFAEYTKYAADAMAYLKAKQSSGALALTEAELPHMPELSGPLLKVQIKAAKSAALAGDLEKVKSVKDLLPPLAIASHAYVDALVQKMEAKGQPAADLSDADKLDALVGGWKAAVGSGKVPSKQQAEAMVALKQSDEDAHQEAWAEAMQDVVHTMGIDTGSELAVKEADAKVTELHGHALAGTTPQDGPKDGDTKQGADGMLVFKDGRWHKMGTDPKVLKKKAASVPLPKFKGTNSIKMSKTAKALKLIAETKGAAGLAEAVYDSKPTGAKVMIKAGGFGWGIHKTPATGTSSANGIALKDYALALQAAMAGTSGAPTATPAPAAPAAAAAPAQPASTPPAAGTTPAGVKKLLLVDIMNGGIQSADGWAKTGGQKGSNSGGFYTDQDGKQWYVKTPASEAHVKNELLANRLYEALGIKVPKIKQVKLGGKLSIASPVIDGLKKDPEALKTSPDMALGFAADCWLSNWDAVGLAFDNALVDAEGGVHRIDPGGALLFRAQGAPKGAAFGTTVTEFDTLRNPAMNPQAASVYGGLTEEQIKESVKQVLLLKDGAIYKLCKAYGPGTPAEQQALAEKLIARKKDIAAKFPDVAAEVKPKKVIEVAPAPNFMEWKGPGQGLSSKPHINQQNQSLANQMQALAADGKLEELEGMMHQPINGDTGAPDGPMKHISEHKSKHIPMYWKDLVQAVKNPIRSVEHMKDAVVETVGGVFGTLISAFEDVKMLKSAAAKIGRYAMLGKVDGDPFESWGIKELSMKNGAINAKDLYDQSHEAYKKLSAIERQAIKEYTGSAYSSMNNPATGVGSHSNTDYAIAGIDKASVPLKPGTVLSRKFSFHSTADVEAFLGSGEGAVLKDFGIISTSLKPEVWSGNVHLRIVCGEGVKGCYVAPDPVNGGKAISVHPGEQEVILPYGTKFFVRKIHKEGHKIKDEHGSWGSGQKYIVEVVALPNT